MNSSNPISRKIGVIDYGMGNLQSVQNSFSFLGYPTFRCEKHQDLDQAELLVLPGVGAFGEAVKNLKKTDFWNSLQEQVIQKKKPILGICLGMQLFFDQSEEMGSHEGLGWIPGKIQSIPKVSSDLKIPHVGWNSLETNGTEKIFDKIPKNTNFYFDHSYVANCEDEFVTSRVQYGQPLVASVKKENIFGVQFHPEKSQFYGLRLLHNFIKAHL